MEETFSLFWGGPYSQWYKSPFIFAGIEFNCNEQMMMYGKAIVHGDFGAAAEVMQTRNPRDQKAIGRRVQNFDFEKWNEICNQIVYTANYCKFTQDSDNLEYLFQDNATTIVEASPYDKVWGIGLGEDDPRCRNRDEWQGENRLGQMITDVRAYLRDPASAYCQEWHVKCINETTELFRNNRENVSW